MFGRETFIVRIADDAMAPRVRAGDYIWIDPDEPAADGRLVAVRDPARGGETVVRLLVERDGRRTLRALDERCPGAHHRRQQRDRHPGRRGVRRQHRVSTTAGAGAHRRSCLPGIDHRTATATVGGARSDRWPRHQAARYAAQHSIRGAPFLEQVAARVGGLGLVPDYVRERPPP